MNNLVVQTIKKYAKYKINKNLNLKYKKELIYPVAEEGKKYLLYLHIPFCKTFCPYCSFHKYAFDEKKASSYYETLRKEIILSKNKGFDFSSVYIGGGTPTILPKELAKTIDLCKELFDIKEVSCEADPNISDELIELLKDRVDRLSVGVQSLNDERLKQTKRCHKFGSSEEQIENLKKLINNFKIVNCDLIFNFPDQTEEELLFDLRKLKSLSPQQISVYPLMHSPSVKKDIENNIGKITNTKEYELYKVILKEMNEDYIQSTCWAFSKKESMNIDEYVVEHLEYLGLGSGAFGFIGDTLFINTFALDEYENKVNENKFSTARYKTYSDNEILNYRLMVDMFGFNFNYDELIKKYKGFLNSKLALNLFLFKKFKIINNYNELTIFGRYLFLTLMKEFYIGMDLVREDSRKDINKFGYKK